jgi:hypothetical protein
MGTVVCSLNARASEVLMLSGMIGHWHLRASGLRAMAISKIRRGWHVGGERRDIQTT